MTLEIDSSKQGDLAAEVRRLEERLRLLSESTRAFAEATVDYGRLLDTITERLSSVLQDCCALSVLTEDERSLTPVSIHATDEDAAGQLRELRDAAPVRLDEPTLTQRVFESGVSALIPRLDIDHLSPPPVAAYRDFLRKLRVHSILIVALRAQGRSLGVLTLLRYGPSSPPFDERDREFAQVLADHAALALSNSRLIRLRRRAEARFDRLSEAGVLGVLVCEITGRVIEMNDTLQRMLGCTRDEVLSGAVSWIAMTPSRWRDTDARALTELKRTGVSSVREKEYTRRDGSTVPVMVGSAMLDDGGGKVISFVLDLTARKQAEAATHIEQARFRALVEKSADGIALSSASGTFLYLSPAAARMLGCTVEEAIGTGFADYLHPDDVAAAADQRRRVLEPAGSATPVARRVMRSDGTFRWVEVTATNLLDDPAVGAIVANIRDITDRKLAAEALVERMRMATLSATVPAALTVGRTLRQTLQRAVEAVTEHVDAALVRIWTLNSARNLLVLEASAGLYTHLDGRHGSIPVGSQLVGSIAQQRRAYASNDLLSDARIDDPEWARREGIVAFAGYPLIARGELVGVVATFARRPLSDVVLESLSSVAHTLAVGIDHHLTECSKTNLEMQLRQAHKMEAVGRLAGGVAHDFNNILSVIMSYGDLLLEDLDAGVPSRDDVLEIRKAASRAAALTHQLLLFSRQQVIEPRVVDLNELLVSMDKMLQRILGEDVKLTSLTKTPVGGVLADAGAMEQVVMNLVVNARDAMPTGGKLTIETADVVLDEEYARQHVGVKAGPHVMLAVSDTGVGMDEATLARLFEPFFTTKDRGKGTGLGLSTVFGIVMQSSGSIWVYSEPGRGTTFKVYLPRVDADVTSVGEPVAPATLWGSETILLVEDEEQVRVIAHGILARYGYEVLEARDAEDAIAICARHPGTIELLLSDVVMPTMSGPELARRLTLVRPSLKVLCMSGYTDDSIVRHGMLDGHFAFLQKPFTPETLARKVREVLEADSP